MKSRQLLRIFSAVAFLFLSCLCSIADEKSPIIKGDPRHHSSPEDKTVSGNMVTEGVPDKFMILMADYIRLSSNDVPHPEYDAYRKSEAEKITKKIKTDYAKEAENYFMLIAQKNRSPYFRICAYNLFFKLDTPSGEMLDFVREELQKIPWDNEQRLDRDIGHQMRVVVAYGDESDLDFWDEIFPKMGEHEKRAFEPYRKMLLNALKNKGKLTRVRAARGDTDAQNKLLGEMTEKEKSDLPNNKQYIVVGVALIVLILIYVILKLRNIKSDC